MRKLTAAVSVLTTAVLLLTGCSNGSGPKSDGGTKDPSVKPAVQNILDNRAGATSFTGTFATYEISTDRLGRALMLRVTRRSDGYTSRIPGVKGLDLDALVVELTGTDNSKVTCSIRSRDCILSKPMVWDHLYVAQPSGLSAVAERTLSMQTTWWNPSSHPLVADKLSNRHGNRSFIFDGEAASFVVEMNKDWKILSVVTLTSDQNSRFNIAEGNRNTECFAGDVCSYVSHPKAFTKLVETHAGGIGRIMTLKQVKSLPSFWD